MSVIVGIAMIQQYATTPTIYNDIVLSILVCMCGCIIEKYLREWLYPNLGYSSVDA